MIGSSRVSAIVENTIAATVDALDFASVVARFWGQNQFVFLEPFFDADKLAPLLDEAVRLKGAAHRNHVPLVRKGGFVGYQTLVERAPAMVALYRSPAFIAFLSRLAGKPLFVKSDLDPHACVLYVYRQWGDHLAYHYDTCGCEQGTSYTALLGLIDRSTQRLDCHLRTGLFRRPLERVKIATAPGSLVAFNGSTIWHGLTRMGRDEERVVLSLSYRTDYDMSRLRRVKETTKDRLLFDGPLALFRKARRS
jgi:hypothetical protein